MVLGSPLPDLHVNLPEQADSSSDQVYPGRSPGHLGLGVCERGRVSGCSENENTENVSSSLSTAFWFLCALTATVTTTISPVSISVCHLSVTSCSPDSAVCCQTCLNPGSHRASSAPDEQLSIGQHPLVCVLGPWGSSSVLCKAA